MTNKNAVKIDNKKIRKMGDYHFFSIPKALLDTNILSTEKEYNITLVESKPKESKNKKQTKRKKASSSH